MTDSQLIDYLIKVAKLNVPGKLANDVQTKTFNARMKRAEQIKHILKRVEYFGGVESLIAKASIVGEKEKLF